VSFTNNQVNFPVANASASINNTGALINVNALAKEAIAISKPTGLLANDIKRKIKPLKMGRLPWMILVLSMVLLI
jgi:hypothetical protein